MSVAVKFLLDPGPGDADSGDPTGLTEAAYNALLRRIEAVGGYDIEITNDWSVS